MLKLSRLIQVDRLLVINCISDFNIKALKMSTTRSVATDAENCLKRELSPSIDNENVDSAKRVCVVTEKVKKKKIAMLLSYSGQGYLGLQRNQGTKTIEEDVLVALLKCNLISEEAYSRPQAIQFQRAARTDKGVSALRQALSLKLADGANIDDINNELPEQIRVMAIRRVTKGFNSKTNCDARTYSYTLPTFAFTPHDIQISEDYRVPVEIIQKVNDILKMFEGTHNFHNFTSRILAQDPSAQRYMIKFSCDQPFVIDNIEFAAIKVKGQSFMLHQIRKMVGLVIAIVRGLASSDVITKAWESERLDIPVAPGLGLLLEEVHYDRYNIRYGKDGIHEPLEWSAYEDKIEAFRQKFITPMVVKTEKEEKSMITWLETLRLHSFDVRNKHIHEQNENVKGGEEEREDHTSSDADELTNNDCEETNGIKKQQINTTH